MNSWKKYRAIKVSQPGGDVYQVSIKGKELANKASVLSRAMDTEGIQRIQVPSRVKRINKFYGSGDALLPNSIIGTISKDEVYYEDGYVYLSPDAKPEIIDGQHRLWGFHDKYNEASIDFDVFFSFLIDADTRSKANLFYKINKEQTKINPSLAYDLLELIGDGTYDENVSEVAKKLNSDENSPFYGLIKLNDGKTDTKKTISLANIVSLIKQFLKTPLGRKGFIRDEKRIHKDKLTILFKNHFSAVKHVFADTWEEENSILLKTLGVGAFTKLIDDILVEFVGEGRLPRVEEIAEILKPAKGFDFNDEQIRGLGGNQGQKVLAGMILEELEIGMKPLFA